MLFVDKSFMIVARERSLGRPFSAVFGTLDSLFRKALIILWANSKVVFISSWVVVETSGGCGGMRGGTGRKALLQVGADWDAEQNRTKKRAGF